MKNLPIDIIKYNINNFLDLKEKINLLNVNKRLKEIQNHTICFHIGNIIADSLGISKKTIKDDMAIINESKIEFLNEIVNICFNQKKYLSFDKTNDKIPLKLLIVIKNYNKNSCKKLLLKKNINFKKSNNMSIQSQIYKNYFYYTYALI